MHVRHVSCSFFVKRYINLLIFDYCLYVVSYNYGYCIDSKFLQDELFVNSMISAS